MRAYTDKSSIVMTREPQKIFHHHNSLRWFSHHTTSNWHVMIWITKNAMLMDSIDLWHDTYKDWCNQITPFFENKAPKGAGTFTDVWVTSRDRNTESEIMPVSRQLSSQMFFLCHLKQSTTDLALHMKVSHDGQFFFKKRITIYSRTRHMVIFIPINPIK